MVLANGKIKTNYKEFKVLLTKVMTELAKKVASDGEGASKFLQVSVNGARTAKDARTAVKSVINSPLVKCAFYGQNPNWGRILSSIGSVLRIDETIVDISFASERGSAPLMTKGAPCDLEPAREVLKARDIKVTVDLHLGAESATGWGCDMTPEYVNINAGYN
jgi:glutamate N-acetyltransferase / amino-acid N-acetyltransferase